MGLPPLYSSFILCVLPECFLLYLNMPASEAISSGAMRNRASLQLTSCLIIHTVIVAVYIGRQQPDAVRTVGTHSPSV